MAQSSSLRSHLDNNRMISAISLLFSNAHRNIWLPHNKEYFPFLDDSKNLSRSRLQFLTITQEIETSSRMCKDENWKGYGELTKVSALGHSAV